MPSKPVYLKATFETPAGLADEAAAILVANGALGCAVERGGRAGPRSRRPVKLEAYFTKLRPEKLRAIRRTMRAAGMLTTSDVDGALQSITDPGWATMWQSRFEPLPIGERFLIVPPWNRAIEAGRIAIAIARIPEPVPTSIPRKISPRATSSSIASNAPLVVG